MPSQPWLSVDQDWVVLDKGFVCVASEELGVLRTIEDQVMAQVRGSYVLGHLLLCVRTTSSTLSLPSASHLTAEQKASNLVGL